MSPSGTTGPGRDTGPEPGASGYDRLGVPGADGGVRWLTKQEFERLSLVDRVRILASGDVTFFRQGQQITPREAMRGRS
jgi:hypothetical protein